MFAFATSTTKPSPKLSATVDDPRRQQGGDPESPQNSSSSVHEGTLVGGRVGEGRHQFFANWMPRRKSMVCTTARRGSLFSLSPVREAASFLPIPLSSPGSCQGPVEVSENAETTVQLSDNIKDYRFLATLGVGATATVYAAEAIKAGSPCVFPSPTVVAIKVINMDHFDSRQLHHLHREIQIMTLSRHPNLLPIYRTVTHTSKLYIITPYRTAGSVRDTLKRKPFLSGGVDEVTLITVMKQVLDGLGYLHEHGLMHRDVKAANVLVQRETGVVQLADFGVSASLLDYYPNPSSPSSSSSASAATTAASQSCRRSFVGSLCWMAPEVLEQTSPYNHRADLWSFGITCLELALGNPPYHRYPPLKTCLLILNAAPPEMPKMTTCGVNAGFVRHRYSKGLRRMVEGCLRKDVGSRIGSAGELARDRIWKKARRPEFLIRSLGLWEDTCDGHVGHGIQGMRRKTVTATMAPRLNLGGSAASPAPSAAAGHSIMDLDQTPTTGSSSTTAAGSQTNSPHPSPFKRRLSETATFKAGKLAKTISLLLHSGQHKERSAARRPVAPPPSFGRSLLNNPPISPTSESSHPPAFLWDFPQSAADHEFQRVGKLEEQQRQEKQQQQEQEHPPGVTIQRSQVGRYVIERVVGDLPQPQALPAAAH